MAGWMGGAEDAESAGHAADENGAAHAACVPSALDEVVGEEAADAEIRDGRDQPGKAGVEERVEQVDVELDGKIAGQPCEQQIEDPVIGADAENHGDNFGLAKQSPKWERGRLVCF